MATFGICCIQLKLLCPRCQGQLYRSCLYSLKYPNLYIYLHSTKTLLETIYSLQGWLQFPQDSQTHMRVEIIY